MCHCAAVTINLTIKSHRDHKLSEIVFLWYILVHLVQAVFCQRDKTLM